MDELLAYKGVEIRQADQIVLHDVNLSVRSGEMIYLLGKVGSGKSSLMKTIYGALPISAGEARVLDYDMRTIKRRKLPYLRRRLGIIFQDYKLLTDRSVEENLLFVLGATGWKDKTLMKNHVREVLEQVGMETKAYKKPYELSGGEQQRVVIARALLNSPELITIPSAAHASVRLFTSTSGSCGSMTGTISRPNFLAKSKSLWS